MSNTPIELKGSSFTLSVVHLHEAEPEVIRQSQALLESGRALWVAPFTTNRLCLSVRAQAMREGEDWL
ncbi:hypothetical protein MJM25_27445, partial [Salmonella enterica subsp. enterica serovar Lubbock]|nr:hypothetical protein [Salmonella enterica subsp. enterica serovar Lubbock]